MKKYAKILFTATFILSIISCSEDNKEAKKYVENIRNLYQNGDYKTAKHKIDSIQILYPKAFAEIKEGLALLQDVRRAEDIKQIAFCDSTMLVLQMKTDSVKQAFIYDRNLDYEETGKYLPKATSAQILSGTILRSGVNEDGKIYLESVYIGGQSHNMVRVSTKDGLFAETLVAEGDGVNYRFNDLGKQYEVLRFDKSDENGVARFVAAFADKPINVTLKGKNTMSYPLSNIAKKSISDSYRLSDLMLSMDSLKSVKEVSTARIKYLDMSKNKKEEQAQK